MSFARLPRSLDFIVNLFLFICRLICLPLHCCCRSLDGLFRFRFPVRSLSLCARFSVCFVAFFASSALVPPDFDLSFRNLVVGLFSFRLLLDHQTYWCFLHFGASARLPVTFFSLFFVYPLTVHLTLDSPSFVLGSLESSFSEQQFTVTSFLSFHSLFLFYFFFLLKFNFVADHLASICWTSCFSPPFRTCSSTLPPFLFVPQKCLTLIFGLRLIRAIKCHSSESSFPSFNFFNRILASVIEIWLHFKSRLSIFISFLILISSFILLFSILIRSFHLCSCPRSFVFFLLWHVFGCFNSFPLAYAFCLFHVHNLHPICFSFVSVFVFIFLFAFILLESY